MKFLYIDANIYLRFFDTQSREFKKLLKSLQEAKKNIFVTEQVHDEVLRNKLDVFIRFFKPNNFGLKTFGLLEHLSDVEDEAIKKWNKTTEEIQYKIKAHVLELEKIGLAQIENILNNKDEVSKILSNIFADNIKMPTADSVKNARIRKERGNPPGKKGDPLGDQLSWEQLLEVIKEGDEIWIITKDGDYLHQFNDNVYLNPFLDRDLKAKNIKAYHVFDSLAKGLKHFSSNLGKEKLASLPQDKELDIITNQEITSEPIFLTTSGSTFPGATGSFGASASSGLFGTSGTSGLFGTSGMSGLFGTSGMSGFFQVKCPKCSAEFKDTPSSYLYSPANGKVNNVFRCPICSEEFTQQ
jgi:hypothetical protein